jgi:hypothetical protein
VLVAPVAHAGRVIFREGIVMARKRSTKLSREAAEKAKLRQRLLDFAIGANGGETPDSVDDDHFLWNLGPAEFGRFLRAIDLQLIDKTRKYCTESHNFRYYETLNSAVDFLYAHGIRHDSTPEDTE